MKTVFYATFIGGPKDGQEFAIENDLYTVRFEWVDPLPLDEPMPVSVPKNGVTYYLSFRDDRHLLYTANEHREFRYGFGAELPPHEQANPRRFWEHAERRLAREVDRLPPLPVGWQWSAEEQTLPDAPTPRRQWRIAPRKKTD